MDAPKHFAGLLSRLDAALESDSMADAVLLAEQLDRVVRQLENTDDLQTIAVSLAAFQAKAEVLRTNALQTLKQGRDALRFLTT